MEDKKMFVAGYYDDRIFEGEYFDGMTLLNSEIEVYSLTEILKIPLVENVKEWVEDTYNKEFDELSYDGKVSLILEYVDTDELGLAIYFSNEEDAKKYKLNAIKELDEIENKFGSEIEYVGRRQDEYGYFREVYKYKEILE